MARNTAVNVSELAEVKAITQLLAKPAKSLRDYFDVGDYLAKLASRSEVIAMKGFRAEVAKVVGVSTETLSKCCQVREKYTAEQLTALERRGVGWGLLTSSFRIADRKRRDRLLKQAIDEEWNGADLGRAIRGLTKSGRGGGRPRRALKSHGLFSDVEQIGSLSEQFNAFLGVWTGQLETYRAELQDLSDEDRQALERTIPSVERGIHLHLKECKHVLVHLSEFRSTLSEQRAQASSPA